MQDGQTIKALFLEHYPGMTEKSLKKILVEAQQRWPLLDVTVVHRIGELVPGEQIVFVGVSSSHRGAAFAACEFIMDFLKTRAPFWKKCRLANSEHWVEAKDSDHQASERW
jgi:molybdopterin synthase catalytic subunit